MSNPPTETININSLYCSSLTPNDKLLLRKRLYIMRMSVLDSLLEKSSNGLIALKLGNHMVVLQSIFNDLLALNTKNSHAFFQLVDHWALPLMLNRLMDKDVHKNRLNQLMNSLVALLLTQKLENGCSSSDQVSIYLTTDKVYGLLQSVEVQVNDERTHNRALTWEFFGNSVKVQVTNEEKDFFTLPLPLKKDNNQIKFIQMPRSKYWDVPVIEDVETLGFDEFSSVENDFGYNDQLDWHPMPITESVDQAYKILSSLWPEILEWSKLLIPAFIDMGGPSIKSVHRSASYGPGSPIFLSKVSNGFEHAEDIVHELQHERLLITHSLSFFTGQRDDCQSFISPYRSDPRPLRGLFLGLHAFIAVNELRLRALRQTSSLSSKERIYQMLKTHRMNLFAFRTLVEYGEISSDGKPLFAEIAEHLSEQHRVIESLATPRMCDEINKHLDNHISAVCAKAEGVVNSSNQYRDWNECAEIASNFPKFHKQIGVI